MIPLVSIVGHSQVGKTFLLERLIPELKQRGYRIATIKHHPHDFEIDKPGKDTWRYMQSGSDTAVISSPEKIALIKKVDHDYTLAELQKLIGNEYDLIIVEGFKRSDAPKIEVHRAARGEELIFSADELIAVATDEKLNISTPQYSLEDISGIVNFIVEKYLDRH